MLHEKTAPMSKVLAVAGLIVYFIIVQRALPEPIQNDAAVYRAGAKVALESRSPYDTALIQAEVARLLPPKHPEDVALNCGFFLPPQAIVVFAPLALVDATGNGLSAGWCFVLTAFGLACGTLAWTFGRSPIRRGTGWVAIVLALLLNPVTQVSLVVGQTGLLLAGCIALGQFCFERGRPRLGCFFWAIIFIKPHLAIPFFVRAWILGGWQRAVGIALFSAILNFFGGLIAYGTIGGAVHLFGEYLEYVGSAHKSVFFNLVEQNYQILSWNRLLAALGGPAIDLKIGTILAGFALWGLLIYGRFQFRPLSRKRSDDAYLVAVTAVGALFFAQVLAYEMVLLVLLAPLILQHFDAGRRGDAWLLVGLLLFLSVPIDIVDRLGDLLRLAEESRGRTLLRSHKSFGMALLAIYLLGRGPMVNCSPSSADSVRPPE